MWCDVMLLSLFCPLTDCVRLICWGLISVGPSIAIYNEYREPKRKVVAYLRSLAYSIPLIFLSWITHKIRYLHRMFQWNISYTSKARFSLPELAARVNGPSWRVAGFHYPIIIIIIIIIIIKRVSDHVNHSHVTVYRKYGRWATREVKTHVGHSIAYNMFLHFMTLLLWPLTFRLKTMPLVGYPKIIPYTKFEEFRISRLFVFELCCGQTDRQTHRQTRMNALLPRLSSAWVITGSRNAFITSI